VFVVLVLLLVFEGDIYKKLTIIIAGSVPLAMKRLACSDVGLDCHYIIEGFTEEEIIKAAIQHYSEIHAIKPEEMTSEMKVRIKDNIHEVLSSE
jgi:predicted small metal-binding protein